MKLSSLNGRDCCLREKNKIFDLNDKHYSFRNIKNYLST